MSEFSREIKPIRVCVCKELCYKQLAHMIVEAEKSQALQLVSSGPRRADHVVQFESKA